MISPAVAGHHGIKKFHFHLQSVGISLSSVKTCNISERLVGKLVLTHWQCSESTHA
mgnify:CR=1 FL=1